MTYISNLGMKAITVLEIQNCYVNLLILLCPWYVCSLLSFIMI